MINLYYIVSDGHCPRDGQGRWAEKDLLPTHFLFPLFILYYSHEWKAGLFFRSSSFGGWRRAAWGVREEEPCVQGRDGPREWHCVILFWTFLLFPVKWFPWHFLLAFKGGEKVDIFFFCFVIFFSFSPSSKWFIWSSSKSQHSSEGNKQRYCRRLHIRAAWGCVHGRVCMHVESTAAAPMRQNTATSSSERSLSLNKLPEAHWEARSGVSRSSLTTSQPPGCGWLTNNL